MVSARQSDGAGGQAASVPVFPVQAFKGKDGRNFSGDGAEQAVLPGAGAADGIGPAGQ